ncbi:MAG: SUMF1/EgtB/PvdO family nonheme iron enzyme [Polyangiaceae bacterium]
MRIAPLLGVVAASGGCAAEDLPPLGQVVLFVDTDAPLPPPPGEAEGPDDLPALFDTARVDVFSADGQCAPCSHEFSVDRDRIGANASLGILPRPGAAGDIARVRLFRAALLTQNEPRWDSTIDVAFALPAVAEGDIEEVTVFLPTDLAGHPLSDLASPLQPEKGRPKKPRVGTWPGAQRVSCAEAAAPDEVCVPGGAYWMGNPSLTTAQLTEPADQQRLVVVQPFFVDRTEVTVGRFRASGLASAQDPRRASELGGKALTDWCTYTETPTGLEEMPINCISWLKAREFCLSAGKDLVSEARYEFVAGALRSWDFVWGRDDASCADAVFGRGGHGILSAIAYAPCKPSEGIGGPLFVGSGARDAFTLPTGTIVDLAGNLSEHALDVWNAQGEPCWTAGVHHDPLCTQQGAVPAAHGVRGGNWVGTRRHLLAARRRVMEESDWEPYVGFRCARPGG